MSTFSTIRTHKRHIASQAPIVTVLAGILIVFSGTPARAQSGDWINLADESCDRILAAGSVVNDLGCGDGGIACEKDFAVGDLNGDGKDDLVVVRRLSFYIEIPDPPPTTVPSNLLFLNEGGVMVDRSDLVAGFEDNTSDRDVVMAHLNAFVDNDLDVVTASTNFHQPRVYMNQGCCSVACDPDTPCPAQDVVPCTQAGNNWCGLKYEPTKLPPFLFPKFCGVAAGDVNGDECPDLYFVDYDNNLEDRLLINQMVGGVCTGNFVDETTTRICADVSDPDCFANSDFGTAAAIADMNDDNCADLVKSENNESSILYNVKNPQGECTGDFTTSIPQIMAGDKTYTVAVGDANGDLKLDLYFVRDIADSYRINHGGGTFSAQTVVLNSPKVDGFGGSVRMADMDNDFDDDVLVSDFDVQFPGCFGQLAILRSDVNPLDIFDVTIFDPLGTASREWNTSGTFDTAVLDVDGDGKLDLWTGTCSGNRLFIQDSVDCNQNGIADSCEPPPFDCNGNGIGDGCELEGNDCNANGLPDDCELAGNDCNANGVFDACEPSDDCNMNGTQDICDVFAGTSLDCNANGVPDECELVGNDCNANGVPDECDVVRGCCLPNGSCQVQPVSCCTGAGGSFGAGTTCDTGACCLPDGTCSDLTEPCCDEAGGCFGGGGSSCATDTCGGCCMVDRFGFGFCTDCTEDGCALQGGFGFDPAQSCPMLCPSQNGPAQWP